MIPDNFKCAYSIPAVPGPLPNISWFHNCAVSRYQTAHDRLSNARHGKRMDNDRWASYRYQHEALYNKLSRINKFRKSKKTRGSWYDADKRANILLHSLDMRRI